MTAAHATSPAAPPARTGERWPALSGRGAAGLTACAALVAGGGRLFGTAWSALHGPAAAITGGGALLLTVGAFLATTAVDPADEEASDEPPVPPSAVAFGALALFPLGLAADGLHLWALVPVPLMALAALLAGRRGWRRRQADIAERRAVAGQRRRMREEGVDTVGEVVEVTDPVDTGDGDVTVEFTLRFTTADGVQRTERIGSRFPRHHLPRVGARATVRHLPDDPGTYDLNFAPAAEARDTRV